MCPFRLPEGSDSESNISEAVKLNTKGAMEEKVERVEWVTRRGDQLHEQRHRAKSTNIGTRGQCRVLRAQRV